MESAPATPLLIVLAALATPALATDHFNLESGIPTTLEDIEPIDSKTAELQTFGRFLRLRGGNSFGQAEPRVALGILEKTQMEIGFPLLLGGEEAGNGNGDVQMSVLRKLRDASQDRWWPGVAIEADLRLPTGIRKHGFRNGVDAGLTALLKKEVGTQGFHVNAGFDWSDDRSEEEVLRRWIWSAGVGHHVPLTGRLVLVSDIAWTQADEEETTDIWLLETGVRAQLARGFIGAIGVGAGLNRGPDTPAFTVNIGFQIGL